MTNVIPNGGFDNNVSCSPTPDPFPWIVTPTFTVICADGAAHSSPNLAMFAGVSGSLSQTGIPTIAGHPYELSFQLKPLIGPLAAGPVVLTINGFNYDVVAPTEDVWNEIGPFFFFAEGPTTDISLTATFANPTNLQVDSFFLEDRFVICYSGKSMVRTRHSQTKKICDIPASDVIAGVHEVYDTNKEKFVRVKLNIVSGPTIRYAVLQKGCLGENKPSDHFLVTSGHVIVVNGVPMKAGDIPQAQRVRVRPEMVYSICTDRGGPILVNNLEVMSYKYQKWIDYAAEKNISWKNNTKDEKLTC